MINSLIVDSLNKVLEFSQNKLSKLFEESLLLPKLDWLIYASILGVFFLSAFASSDSIGYLALVTLLLTVVKILLKKGEELSPNIFEWFLILYFLFVVISLMGSSLFYLSLKGFLKTFTYLGFYFSLVQFFRKNTDKIPLTLFVIAFVASTQGIIGLFQNFSQVAEISTWQDVSNINPEDVMTRVYGTLHPYNPNLLGGYLVASLPSLIGSSILFLLNKNKFFGLLGTLLTLLTSYTLILTGCRGAYIGSFVIFASFFALMAKFIWDYNQQWLKSVYLSFLGFMVTVSAFIVLFVSSIRTRIFSIFAMRNDSSTSFRLNVYQSALQMFKDNWLVGIGVGNQNYREIYGLYMKTGFDALSAYCVFLEIAVESGIFALIAFVLFLTGTFYSAIKFIRGNKDVKSCVIVSTALISVVAVMLHGLVDTVFFRPQIQFVFWFMVSVISVSHKK